MMDFIRKSKPLKLLLIIGAILLWGIAPVIVLNIKNKPVEPIVEETPMVVYDVDNSPSTYESDIELYEANTTPTVVIGNEVVSNGNVSYWYFTYRYTDEKGKKQSGSTIKKLDVPYYDDFKLCKSVYKKADGGDNPVIIDFVMEVNEISYKKYKDAY